MQIPGTPIVELEASDIREPLLLARNVLPEVWENYHRIGDNMVIQIVILYADYTQDPVRYKRLEEDVLQDFKQQAPPVQIREIFPIYNFSRDAREGDLVFHGDDEEEEASLEDDVVGTPDASEEGQPAAGSDVQDD